MLYLHIESNGATDKNLKKDEKFKHIHSTNKKKSNVR